MNLSSIFSAMIQLFLILIVGWVGHKTKVFPSRDADGADQAGGIYHHALHHFIQCTQQLQPAGHRGDGGAAAHLLRLLHRRGGSPCWL